MEKGAEVVLSGLSKPGMNGMQGVLGDGPNSKGRWPVKIPALGGKSVAIKPENIEIYETGGSGGSAPPTAAVAGVHQRMIEACLVAFTGSTDNSAREVGLEADGGAAAAAAGGGGGGEGGEGGGKKAIELLDELCCATARAPALDCPPTVSVALIDAVVAYMTLTSRGLDRLDGGNRNNDTAAIAQWLKICSRNRALALHLALPTTFGVLVESASSLRTGVANSIIPAEMPAAAAVVATTLAPASSETAEEAIKCIVNVLLQCPTEACQSAVKVKALERLTKAAVSTPETFWRCREDYKVMCIRAILLLITRSAEAMESARTSGCIAQFAALTEHCLREQTIAITTAAGTGTGAAVSVVAWPGEERASVLVEVLRVYFKLLDALPLKPTKTAADADARQGEVKFAANTGGVDAGADEGNDGEDDEPAARLIAVACAVLVRADAPYCFALRDAAVHVLMNTPETLKAQSQFTTPALLQGLVVHLEHQLALVSSRSGSKDADDDWAAAVCPVATVLCFAAGGSRLARRGLRATLLPRVVDRRKRALSFISSFSSSSSPPLYFNSWSGHCLGANALVHACEIAHQSRPLSGGGCNPYFPTYAECNPCDVTRCYIEGKGPGTGIATSDKLINLLTSANGNVREAVTSLLFVLTNQNTARFVRRVGFGNAAGFLQSRGIFQPNDLGDDSGGGADSDTDSGTEDDDAGDESGGGGGSRNTASYNPITGAEWDTGPSPADSMTEDQKEHAAHELLILMDKMNKLGVMKAQLPTEPTTPTLAPHAKGSGDEGSDSE